MTICTPVPIIERLRNKLRCKKGISTYMAMLIGFVCLIMLFVAILEVTRVNTIYIGIRDAVESSITTTATSNSYNTYHGVREGNSGAYTPDGAGGWTKTVTTADVVYKLRSLLNLKSQGGGYVHLYSGRTDYEYKIYNIHVEAIITPLGDNTQQSKYLTTCVVEVPLSFGFGHLPSIRLNMRHQSTYVSRF